MYCYILNIPKFEDLKMFSSYKIKISDDIELEFRVANVLTLPEAIAVYKYRISDDYTERLFVGRLNEANYKLAMKILREHCKYERTKDYKNKISKEVIEKANKEDLNVTVKDLNGHDLHIGDRVRCHNYTNLSNYVNGIIERFAKTTIRVLINGKIPRYYRPELIELVTDDTVETLRIKRSDIKHLKDLLEKYNSDSELLYYLSNILGGMKL